MASKGGGGREGRVGDGGEVSLEGMGVGVDVALRFRSGYDFRERCRHLLLLLLGLSSRFFYRRRSK